MKYQEKRTPLKSGNVLQLVDDNNGRVFNVTIIKELGSGSNCIAYDVEFDDFVRGVLKECWPAKLAVDICRNNETLALELANSSNENARNNFLGKIEKFEADYRRGVDFRKENEEIWNCVPAHKGLLRTLDFHKGEVGTLYSLYSIDRGDSLRNLPPKTAHDVFGVAASAARGLKIFHESGQVYLDFKADNLFVFPEKNNYQVKFLDSDASIDISELHNEIDFSFFSTMDWEAPEMKDVWEILEEGGDDLEYRRKIDKRTDFYLVGLLVDKLLGTRYKEATDLGGDWDFDFRNELLKDVNPSIRRKLRSFYEKTVVPARNKRYQKDDDIIEALEELYELALTRKPYINTHVLFPNKTESEFVGREAEIIEIERMLENHNSVFLCGIGGIGKSELALQYISKHKEGYECILQIDYQDNLIASAMRSKVISNYDLSDFKSDEEKWSLYYEKLCDLCDWKKTKVLIYIDNFNTDYDEYLSKFRKLDCKMIFTTRGDEKKYGDCGFLIEEIKDITQLKRLFYINGPEEYKNLLQDNIFEPNIDRNVEKLVKLVGGHTLVIELLATQLLYSVVLSLEHMLMQLEADGIKGDYKTPFHSLSQKERLYATAYGHIETTFNLSNLNEGEMDILKVLTHVPSQGVDMVLFLNWCGFRGEEGVESVNDLVRRKWVRRTQRVISLHPVIREVVWRKLNPCVEEGLLAKYSNSLLKQGGGKNNEMEKGWLLDANVAFILSVRGNTFTVDETMNSLYKNVLSLMNISETEQLLEALKAITPIVIKKYSNYDKDEILHMLSIEVLDVDDDDSFTKKLFLEAFVLYAWLKSKLEYNNQIDAATIRLQTNIRYSANLELVDDYLEWFNDEYVAPVMAFNDTAVIKFDLHRDDTEVKGRDKLEIRKWDGSVEIGEIISFFELRSTGKKYVAYQYLKDKQNLLPDGHVVLQVAEAIVKGGMLQVGPKMDEVTWENLKDIIGDITKGKRPDDVKYIEIEYLEVERQTYESACMASSGVEPKGSTIICEEDIVIKSQSIILDDIKNEPKNDRSGLRKVWLSDYEEHIYLISCIKLKKTNKIYIIFNKPSDIGVVLPEGNEKVYVAEIIINESGRRLGAEIESEVWEHLKQIMRDILKEGELQNRLDYIHVNVITGEVGGYTGDKFEGKRHGKGVQYWKREEWYDRYIGDWKYDIRTGEGVYTFSNGDYYAGGFSENRFHGKGKMIWANGDKYDGDWESGERTGKGIYTLLNRYNYAGDFLKNKAHGKGQIIWTNGDKYEGDWKNGERTGEGVLTFADGEIYNGSFYKGKYYGEGQLISKSGVIFKGFFADGKIHGRGRVIFSYNEKKYEIASDVMLKSLELLTEIQSKENIYIASVYFEVGRFYFRLGQHDEQIKYELEALNIRKRLLSEKHCDLLSSYKKVADCYYRIGKHDEALEKGLKVLVIRLETLPENHPEIISSYNGLVKIYATWLIERGVPDCEVKKVQALEKTSLIEYKQICDLYNYIGVWYIKKGQPCRAVKFGLHALRIQKEHYPNNYHDLALIYNNIGKAYHDMQEYDTALSYLQEAVKSIGNSSNEIHYESNIYFNIGITHDMLNNCIEATGNLERAELLLIKNKDNTRLKTTYSALIRRYQSRKQYQKAEEYNQKLKALCS